MRKKVLIILAVILIVIAMVLGIIGVCIKGHSHTYAEQTVAPTCTEQGYTLKKCKCGKEIKSDYVDALGHDYSSELTVDMVSTCITKGSESRHCTRCDAKTEVTEIPLAAHTYVDGRCSICGKDDIYEATGLEYVLSSDRTYYIVKGIGVETKTIFTIPDTYNGKPVKEIAGQAFFCRNSLSSVTIGNNVTSIGSYAFAGCGNLTKITLGDNVSSIGQYALICTSVEVVNEEQVFGSSKLESINVTENNMSYKSIDGNLYSKDGKTLVQYAIGKTDKYFTFPDGVTSIGENAFASCDGLKIITIPDSVTSIGAGAFVNCNSLTNVTIGDNVSSIGERAFNDCSNLTSVTIGRNVESIGEHAFSVCYTLVEVINNSSLVLTKGSEDYGRVAYYALNIKNGGTSDIVNKDNFLFYTYDTTNYLISYMGDDTAYTYNIELTLPESYNNERYEIYRYAFNNCKDLESVIISDNITSIGKGAFEYCYNLKRVTIGNKVTSIGEDAFKCCINLETVSIGSSLTSIGNYAFNSCAKLVTINYNGTMESWNTITKGYDWSAKTDEFIVTCSDGTVSKTEE